MQFTMFANVECEDRGRPRPKPASASASSPVSQMIRRQSLAARLVAGTQAGSRDRPPGRLTLTEKTLTLPMTHNPRGHTGTRREQRASKAERAAEAASTQGERNRDRVTTTTALRTHRRTSQPGQPIDTTPLTQFETKSFTETRSLDNHLRIPADYLAHSLFLRAASWVVFDHRSRPFFASTTLGH